MSLHVYAGPHFFAHISSVFSHEVKVLSSVLVALHHVSVQQGQELVKDLIHRVFLVATVVKVCLQSQTEELGKEESELHNWAV